MPPTKAAHLRHLIIDECLRNDNRRWTRAAILKSVNDHLRTKQGDGAEISMSTLRNDITAMEFEYGAPIEEYKNGRELCYRYEDPDYSIKNLPVNSDELSKLNLAVHILKQIQGFPLVDEVEEVVKKLERKAKVAGGSQPQIAFENKPVAQNTDYLGDIYEAIIDRRVLKIAYQHFKATEPSVQTIHPYFLKEYNSRWFLFGWSDQNQRIEIMALDRMVSIKVTSIEYRDNDFVPDEHFTDIIGVTDPGTPVEKVELCFCSDRAPYIITRKLHHSQKELKRNDGSVVVTLHLKINREFVALVLGYAEDVEVLSPESLRNTIRDKHRQAVALYQ